MQKFRPQADRYQTTCFPASIDEYVPQDDIVRYIDAMIDALDLSTIESHYSHEGRPAYHPQVLVKLLLYGKMRGVRSSRELARAARENIRFMFLTNNETPDFRTILLFRKRFQSQLAALLRQTIHIGLREGIIDLDHVSIDGTKLRAFAGRNSFRTPKRLRKDLVRLEQEIATSIAHDIALDTDEEAQYHGGDCENTLPADLATKQALVTKIKNALHAHDTSSGTPPKRISLTDPDCRYMKGKGILPAYNGQVAVDRSSRMAVGGFISTVCTDQGLLAPMLENMAAHTGTNPTTVTADCGYADYEALVALDARNIEGYIPRTSYVGDRFTDTDFIYDSQRDCYHCPHGRLLVRRTTTPTRTVYTCQDCTDCPLRAQCLRHVDQKNNRSLNISVHKVLSDTMRRKTETAQGAAMARIRGSTVEPVFGYLKYSKKLHHFLVRGKDFVNAMWQLELVAYNIERLAKWAQRRTLARCAA